METRPQALMVGGTWEMGESQLGDLVFGQTRCTQMRVRLCGPAKQFIHSLTQQVFIKCYPCPRHGGRAGGRHEWSLTSQSFPSRECGRRRELTTGSCECPVMLQRAFKGARRVTVSDRRVDWGTSLSDDS